MSSLKLKRLRELLSQITVTPPRLGKGCACTQWETCPACWARLAGKDARETYELAEFKKQVEEKNAALAAEGSATLKGLTFPKGAGL